MKYRSLFKLLFTLSIFAIPLACFAQSSIEILESEFIYEEAPFPSCHASSIAELEDGSILATWFGGSDEGEDDVEIWISKLSDGTWSAPLAMTNYPKIPTWNPVLFEGGDKLWLYFKIGPTPRAWAGARRYSLDSGETWSETEFLPAGLLGPVRAKPITLNDGGILAGTSFEAGYRRDSPKGAPYKLWSSWVNRSYDGGDQWTIHGPMILENDGFGTIQPTLWQADDGKIHSLMRTTSRQGFLAHSVSDDLGETWSPAVDSGLPNPSAGVDVVKMEDGRVALIYNHLNRGRHSIHLAFSNDDGNTWEEPIVLEDEENELSYPAIIQLENGELFLSYTHNRTKIRVMRVKAM